MLAFESIQDVFHSFFLHYRFDMVLKKEISLISPLCDATPKGSQVNPVCSDYPEISLEPVEE